jgi:hypothetical protein
MGNKLMKISKVEKDFYVYIENDNKEYIKTSYIKEALTKLDKRIKLDISLTGSRQIQTLAWTMQLTINNIKSLNELLNEVVKQLEANEKV